MAEPPPVTTESKLFEYGTAWREAAEVAEAHRVRVRRAVLEALDAGMRAPEAAKLTGVSRVTVHSWSRQRRLADELET